MQDAILANLLKIDADTLRIRQALLANPYQGVKTSCSVFGQWLKANPSFSHKFTSLKKRSKEASRIANTQHLFMVAAYLVFVKKYGKQENREAFGLSFSHLVDSWKTSWNATHSKNALMALWQTHIGFPRLHEPKYKHVKHELYDILDEPISVSTEDISELLKVCSAFTMRNGMSVKELSVQASESLSNAVTAAIKEVYGNVATKVQKTKFTAEVFGAIQKALFQDKVSLVEVNGTLCLKTSRQVNLNDCMARFDTLVFKQQIHAIIKNAKMAAQANLEQENKETLLQKLEKGAYLTKAERASLLSMLNKG